MKAGFGFADKEGAVDLNLIVCRNPRDLPAFYARIETFLKSSQP